MTMRIKVWDDFQTGQTRVAFVSRDQANNLHALSFTSRVFLPVAEGAVLPPDQYLEMSWSMKEEFEAAMKEYVLERGLIRPNTAEGELRAMRYHLEDMRRLAMMRQDPPDPENPDGP